MVGYADGAATSAQFNEPLGLAYHHPSGLLLVGEHQGSRIRGVNLSTGAVSTFAGNGGTVWADGPNVLGATTTPWVVGVRVSLSGDVYFPSQNIQRLRVARCSACPAGHACPTAGGLAAPVPCAAAPGWHCPPGSSSTAAVEPCPAGFYCSGGAAPAMPCDCALASCPTPGLAFQPPATWQVTTVAGGGAMGLADGLPGVSRLNAPTGISLNAAESRLYIGSLIEHRIRVLHTGNNSLVTLAGTGATSGLPGGGTFLDGPALSAGFNQPYGVMVNAADTVLYISDNYNHRIRVMDLVTRIVSTFAGSGVQGTVNGVGTAAQFNAPNTAALHEGSGMLYVLDQFEVRIRFIVCWPAGWWAHWLAVGAMPLPMALEPQPPLTTPMASLWMQRVPTCTWGIPATIGCERCTLPLPLLLPLVAMA